MKKVLSLIAFVIIMLSAGSQAMAQRSFALCMGLSKCGTPTASDISCAQHDAIDMAKVLKKQGYTTSALTNENATRETIIKRLRGIANATTSSDDKIVLYFATHGSDNGYLTTYGGEFIKYSEIIDILSQGKTSHIYCFVMACFSGSAAQAITGDPSWRDNAVKRGITFIVSSRPDEESQAITLPYWKHSVFGQAVIKGLRGDADYDDDRNITLMELFRYTYNEVTGRLDGSKDVEGLTQHPQLIGPKAEHNAVLASW